MKFFQENQFSKTKISCNKEIIYFSTPKLATSLFNVGKTHHHHSLIIFKPTSNNPMESKSQNIFHHDLSHFEIPNDGGDEDAQENRKKILIFSTFI